MRITGFIWLDQYVEKMARKHNVIPEEVEEVFELAPQYRFVEKGHISGENLYAALGRTDAGRYVTAFFIHKEDGRALIISARNMDDAEKKLYRRQ